MDIIIGKTASVQFNKQTEILHRKEKEFPVRLLHVRPARSSKNNFWQGKERRDTEKHVDPFNAKVLIVLVPDGSRLPADLHDGKYEFRLRIVSEKDDPAATKASTPSENIFSQRV